MFNHPTKTFQTLFLLIFLIKISLTTDPIVDSAQNGDLNCKVDIWKLKSNEEVTQYTEQILKHD